MRSLLLRVAALAFCVTQIDVGGVAAQDAPVQAVEEGDESDFFETAPPPDLFPFAKLNRAFFDASTESVLRTKSVISQTLLFNTSNGPIKVCFRDGAENVIRELINHARLWELPNSSVRFDFGANGNPRRCGSNFDSAIRISFAGRGNWSVIGLQSSLTTQTTMNFDSTSGFANPAGRKFRRTVLHEFGHALGLYHEHQNPNGNCTDEINWPVAKTYFFQAGYVASEQEIIENFGNLTTDVVASSFDPNSIMLYNFPKQIFRAELFENEQRPKCHFDYVNFDLSEEDRRAIAANYDADPGKVREQRRQSFERARALFERSAGSKQALALLSVYYPFESVGQADVYVAFAKASLVSQ